MKNHVTQTAPIKPKVNGQFNVTPTHPSHSISASEAKKKKKVLCCLFKLDWLLFIGKNISVTKAIAIKKGRYLWSFSGSNANPKEIIITQIKKIPIISLLFFNCSHLSHPLFYYTVFYHNSGRISSWHKQSLFTCVL